MFLCLKYYTHLCVVLSLKFIDIQSVRPWYLASFLHKMLHRVFSLGSVIYRKKYSAESQKWRISTIKYFLRKTCAKCNKTWTTLRTLVKYITTHSTHTLPIMTMITFVTTFQACSHQQTRHCEVTTGEVA